MIKKIIWITAYITIFINIFIINIAIHELGHYIAADHYNLEPEISFKLENVTNTRFRAENTPLAYTSFNQDENKEHIITIALLGPITNLLMSIIFLIIFVTNKKNNTIQEFSLICIVVSLGSFVMNIIPIEGSDGWLIANLIGII